MPYFVARYTYTEDAEARAAVRPQHREFLKAQESLVASGPTDDNGALLVFDAESRSEVEAILDDDPFAALGVIASRTVFGWDIVLGSWAAPLPSQP